MYSSLRSSALFYLLAVCLTVQGAALSLRAQDIPLKVVERSLKNGMKVLMVERHDSPTVSLYLLFRVGGVDDPKGRTGIAHLLEHMMFKGTKIYGTTNFAAETSIMEKIDQVYAQIDAELQKANTPGSQPDQEKIKELENQMKALQEEQKKFVVNDELWQTYQRLGGVGLNASTGDESTQYFVQLPSNQLEVWAFMEADRLANPVFREFYPERDVVHEERRMRTDTQPDGLLWEKFMATAFEASPYQNPVIGWPSDLENMRREEVLEYFKTFYAPNNAIAAIVGDIDPDKTFAIMEKYFGSIPSQPQPRRYISQEPPQKSERRIALFFDAQPQLMIGYHIPQIGHKDTYALDVLGQVLGGVSRGSRTGRLYKSLVLDKKVALEVNSGAYTSLYPNLFIVSATPAENASPAEVEKAIYEEFLRLEKEPPTDEELARVRNSVDASLIRSLRSNFGVARIIASAEHMTGTWRYIFSERDELKSVSAQDVQRVAKQYFGEDNRTVGEIRPINPSASAQSDENR